MTPFFSIVMATFGRGAHILPSIRSVLCQTYPDFELIVVGDCCQDDTGAAVENLQDARVSWCNLPKHWGSQSGPNNAGIERASGKWICYLGHDDVWAPEHLAQVANTIAHKPYVDVVVAGCIYYGCETSGLEWITGLFDAPDAASEHFFPPSSIAHRRDVTARIGRWRRPQDIRAPVDTDFLVRCAEAGLHFVSTATITAHKFAAGHRYLAYLRHTSGEQSAMLERLSYTDRGWIDDIRIRTAQGGRLMTMRHMDYGAFAPGALFAMNRSNKGLARPVLRPLRKPTVFPQTADSRALDWYELDGRFRWTGPSRRPKLLLPFTGAHAHVAMEVGVGHPHPTLDRLFVEIGGTRVDHHIEEGELGRHWLRFSCLLSPDDWTVVTFDTPDMVRPCDITDNDDSRWLGMRAGEIHLTPGVDAPRT